MIVYIACAFCGFAIGVFCSVIDTSLMKKRQNKQLEEINTYVKQVMTNPESQKGDIVEHWFYNILLMTKRK